MTTQANGSGAGQGGACNGSYTSWPMARRPTKLQFYEHPVTCPHCGAKVIVTSLMERILVAGRTCPVCKREMFIDDGRAAQTLNSDFEIAPRNPALRAISMI